MNNNTTVAMEAGTHSLWISRLLNEMGLTDINGGWCNFIQVSNVSSRRLRGNSCNSRLPPAFKDCVAKIAAPTLRILTCTGAYGSPSKECGWKRDG